MQASQFQDGGMLKNQSILRYAGKGFVEIDRGSERQISLSSYSFYKAYLVKKPLRVRTLRGRAVSGGTYCFMASCKAFIGSSSACGVLSSGCA